MPRRDPTRLQPLRLLGRRPFSLLLLLFPLPLLVPSHPFGGNKTSFCWITILIFIGDDDGLDGIGNDVEPLGVHIQRQPTMHEEEVFLLRSKE